MSRNRLGKEPIQAIRGPLAHADVRVDDDAAEFVFARSGGYPYFIQEWGFQLWNFVQREPISLEDTRAVDAAVSEKLDRSFFRMRVERLTGAEKSMLYAMSELGGTDYPIADIASRMGMSSRTLSPRRSSLIAKGMIYSPRPGVVSFTVPLFSEYLRRCGVSKHTP